MKIKHQNVNTNKTIKIKVNKNFNDFKLKNINFNFKVIKKKPGVKKSEISKTVSIFIKSFFTG